MIIDSHAHVSVRSQADWDLDSDAEVMKYCHQRFIARPHVEVRRIGDDSVVEDGWKTLWDPERLHSWDGARDVGLRVSYQRPGGPTTNRPPFFTWRADGEDVYAMGDLVLKMYKAPPPEVLLPLMDAVGVDRAVLQLPPVNLNKFFSRVVNERPTRFIGLCNVDESTAYTSESLDRLHVYAHEYGLRGFYHEPMRGWEGYDDFHTAKFDPFWRTIDELGLVMYIGGPYGNDYPMFIPMIEAVVKKFPGLQIILTNGILQHYLADGIPDELDRVINGYNVHTELLTNIVNFGENDEVIRLLYDAFGPSKLIWGSEYASYNGVGPPFFWQQYAESRNYIPQRCDYMSDADLRLIHGGNIQRIFNIKD
jgi:predicted TIM-barrel fold metal-dependent hydrolase